MYHTFRRGANSITAPRDSAHVGLRTVPCPSDHFAAQPGELSLSYPTFPRTPYDCL
jgi:hypothetical protein